MEFHISRATRERYDFDESLFTLTGNVIFADFHAVRRLAQKMNRTRDLIRFPEQAVRAGQINAMGLIDEILHLVVRLYRRDRNPHVMEEALTWLEAELGREAVDLVIHRFIAEFPPLAVYRGAEDIDTYLAGDTEGVPNRAVALEELLLLWLANANPAFSPFLELFDARNLETETAYRQVIARLSDFFDEQPHFGPEHQNLVEMLRSPAIAVPHSLSGQLEYIRARWGHLLGDLLFRILSGLDLIAEEQKAVFFGPGPSRVYEYWGLDLEPERFSPDSDWMPRVVLIAKNAFVWLDQLSKRYQREIQRLDQIPDEELNRLEAWGFTGLWLIGLWERSQASQRIKQLCGNPDAVASAYSLMEYQIAADLGGEQAYQNLKDRAWQRGIRLSSDMVPNHMGIDSRWVIEHPDWFIGQGYSPFPSYSFSGPNLSPDDRVGIYLEDHYYDRTDAAVVFKRVDHHTGSERFVYHGNDGTSMPWNDTAQLDFMHPAVREAVIQTILHVARMFPIIRFDAAMTLAKRHFQRLWYPEPGTGGAIASRAEHGLTKAEFDRRFPAEFWREVVDRVAQEVPDTLLLAEAFWLMEGYFVRTLGMHRVYNSAFMNMLRDEENANYRSVMKNTLEFDPEILKRFVNFMNNPDERTAVDQFGKGDKYFGICTLLATLPGLPMIGHGQIEGFAEKYGMEFYRAYWDEEPDQDLVARHEREIFPLLHRRWLFADVENFLLYDFFTPEGHVNEDVFAYSNRSGEARGLVVYHNTFGDTRGWIRASVAYAVKDGESGSSRLEQKNLGEGLNLRNKAGVYTIFRDTTSGLEYLRPNSSLFDEGLYVELGAYQYHVFQDFREVEDDPDHPYAELSAYLDGRGVPDIEQAARELLLRPLHYPYRELINPGFIRWLMDQRGPEFSLGGSPETLTQVSDRLGQLLREAATFTLGKEAREPILDIALTKLDLFLKLPHLDSDRAKFVARNRRGIERFLSGVLSEDDANWGIWCGWLFTHLLGRVQVEQEYEDLSRAWVDEWLLGKILHTSLTEMDLSPEETWRSVLLIKLLISHHRWYQRLERDPQGQPGILHAWLSDSDGQAFLQINRYQGVLWFNQEAFEDLVRWMFAVSVVDVLSEANLDPEEAGEAIMSSYRYAQNLLAVAERSGFRVDQLLDQARA